MGNREVFRLNAGRDIENPLFSFPSVGRRVVIDFKGSSSSLLCRSGRVVLATYLCHDRREVHSLLANFNEWCDVFVTGRKTDISLSGGLAESTFTHNCEELDANGLGRQEEDEEAMSISSPGRVAGRPNPSGTAS